MAVELSDDLRARTDITGHLSLCREVLDRQFDTPFIFFDSANLKLLGTLPTSGPWQEHFAELQSCLRTACYGGEVSVQQLTGSLQALVIPFMIRSWPGLIAVGLFATGPMATEPSGDAGHDGNEGVLPSDLLRYCDPELLRRSGMAVIAAVLDRLQLHGREAELRQLAAQLSRNYEEITLLHQLNRASQVSQGTRELQDLTLSLLAEILPVRQIAFVDARKETLSSVGESILLPQQCRDLIEALDARNARDVVVENHVLRRGWPAELTQVERLICVPVAEGKELFGWLLALGTTNGLELGSVEASLITAVAAILATHQTNVRLYGNIKELFLGVVRALSSAIDAKDPYTCGHSERVARLARGLAQELGLPEDDRNRIYLSGLLHDVGKIGIRDSVLRKPGRLSAEERSHIQEHPKIGFDILSGVRQLRPVLAGVRSHHENMDGTGYPDGLKGDDIPLMARIVAVADAYDAMNSDRPYRQGMDRDQIERIFRQGAGKQWDQRVVEALLCVREATHQRAVARNGHELAVGYPNSCDSQFKPGGNPLDMSKISEIISLSAS